MKRNIIQEVMSEHIIYGGLLATREQVYNDVLALGHSARAAEMFACGPRAVAVNPDDYKHLRTLPQMREVESRA